MDNQHAQIIFTRLSAAYPQADTELNYNNLFELLIAVVLSAQSTDAQVNKVTEKLFAQVDNPKQLASLPVDEIEQYIKGVGLYRTKAQNIKKIAEILLTKYNGSVPEDFYALLSLPGVGRKTANVVWSVGFRRPGLGVDTHVQRLANRIGLVNTKTPSETEKQLKALFPPVQWTLLHHLLIHHGRKVCKARQPLCEQCTVAAECLRRI